MASALRSETAEAVLNEWRTRILNGFLILTVIAELIGLSASILEAVHNPQQWISVFLYGILAIPPILLAIFRRIDYQIRAWGILAVAYTVSLIVLATLGLSGSGRLYLLSLPVAATILLGIRSGILVAVVSVITLFLFSFLAGSTTLLLPWIRERNSLSMADWLAESSDTLMLLLVNMSLLVLFYRFQEKLISRERRSQTIIEEQNATLEERIEERTAELRRSEEQYRLLAENSGDVIFTMAPDLRFTYVSPSILKMIGTPADQVMKMNFQELGTPESLERVMAEYRRILPLVQAGQSPTSLMEVEHFRADGTTVWSEVSVRTMRDSQGNHAGYVGVSRDIDSRKRSERALRESERRLADIIDFLPIATLVIDNAGRVAAWNRALEEMTGFRSEDMLGKGNYEYAVPFYGERRPILIDMVDAPDRHPGTGYRNVRLQGGILTAESQATLAGKDVVLMGFAGRLLGADGEVCGAIESIRDVTDLRRAEAKLKEARDAAEAANRSKSIFLANMSHEIRTPMNAILGFVQLMNHDSQLTEEQREHLEIIHRSGAHLLALINDILELSKIEAGRSEFLPGRFDLHKLLDDMAVMFRVRTQDKKLWLRFEREDEVPRWVSTDEGKLRQVLINLIGNAVKFTASGGVCVRAGTGQENGQPILCFEVEDTGPGISPEEAPHLFKAFEQASAGLRIGGTGLGLALCRGFVEIMGGILSVSSEVDRGSTFRFSIPIRAAEGSVAEAPEERKRILRLELTMGEVRVLVVDDRETNRQFLSRMLSMAGFSIREAANGLEAIEQFRTWHPRIILMDMSMPVMSGYEALQAIKKTPEGRQTVVIAVTASAFHDDRQKILEAGADGYLSKPFLEEDLLETIGRLARLDYLYDGEEPDGVQTAAEPAPISAADLASLPSELRSACMEAAENADFFLLEEQIRKISDFSPTVAERLADLAGRYHYEGILALLSPRN